MTERAAFALRGRNPDVLTCIANLSNDEVFTPPELANRMLDTLAEGWAADHDGASIWADRHVTFLDPCTKSGVFLREITSRLTIGLEQEIPDLQARVNHILTRQVFGIALTRLTALLARRSVYCSKHAKGEHSIATSLRSDDGNVWFERMDHTWEQGRCRYCRAAKGALDRGDELESHAYAFIHTDKIRARIAEQFGVDMQFDVIIGNPPYQLADEAGAETPSRTASASPIYHLFVEQAKQLEPRYLCMIIPARWMAGGRGLDQFRNAMLSDRSVSVLVDYPSATDVFGKGVRVSGGVCYFLREANRTGLTRVTTIRGTTVVGPVERQLDEYDIFIRDSEATSIVHRVLAMREPSVASMFSSGFGLDTNFSAFHASPRPHALVLHLNIGGMGHQRATRFIERSQVSRNRELIDRWKVLVPSAAGYGAEQEYDRVLGRPILAGPGEVGTQTYRVIGPFDSEAEARSFISYYSTRFFRFLASLRKVTQHASPAVYSWIPVQSWDRMWSDEELNAKYSLSPEEQAFIATRVRDVGWAQGENDG